MRAYLKWSGLALLALAGLRAPARAQNLDVYNYSFPLEYQTQGRSYWGDNTQLGVTPADTFSASWNVKNKEFGDFFDISTPDVDLGLLGTIPGIDLGEFGMKGTVTATGELGFRYEANASGGSVDVSSPITVRVAYPKFTFDPNQTGKREFFPVYVSFDTNDNATIQTQSPDASFAAYLIGRNFELRGSVTAKAFDESKTIPIFGDGFGPWTPKGFRLKPPDPNDSEQTLWSSFETTDDGTMQIFSSDILKNLITRQVPLEFEYPSKKGYFNSVLDPPFITTEMQFPKITSQGSRSSLPAVGPNGLSSTGEDWFSSTTLDVTNLLTYILHKAEVPVPPLNFNQTVDLGFGSGTIDYSSLDVQGNLTFGLKQDFNFVPKPTVSLEYQFVGDSDTSWKPLFFIDPADLAAHRNDPGGAPANLYNKASWTFGSTRNQVQALVEMPSSRAVRIRPKVTFDNAFDHTVSLTATGGVSATLLDINVSGEAGGYSLGKFEFKPVDPIGTSATGAVKLKTIGPYRLGGFDTALKTGDDFQVIQQDVALPQIDTVTPDHGKELNSVFGSCFSDPSELPDLQVQFQSAVDPKLGARAPWPADTRFFLDGSDTGISNDGRLQNDTVVVARIEPDKLTPGIHHVKVVANVMIGTGSGSVSVPVERTVDFPVYSLEPKGEQIGDPEISNESEQFITQLPLHSGDKKLYIVGQFITTKTVLLVNGEPVKITSSSGCDRIDFTLPAKFTEQGGTLQIDMVNPDYGGGLVKANQPLKLFVPNPAPVMRSVALGVSVRLASPGGIDPGTAAGSLTVGGGDTTVTIHGDKFVPTSKATVDGQDRELRFVSATEVVVKLLASDLAAPGQRTVKIQNPVLTLPDGSVVGGIDSGGTFETQVNVNFPAPKVTYMSPGLGYQGANAFTLTVNGSDFVQGAKVTFNGTERATTFVSPQQLTVGVTAADLSSVGFKDLVVTNPAPGGGASNVGKFEVRVPEPCRPGDADGSGGRLDVRDVIKVLRHAVGLEALTGVPLRAADINADHAVDVSDAVVILKVIVGLAETPAACAP